MEKSSRANRRLKRGLQLQCRNKCSVLSYILARRPCLKLMGRIQSPTGPGAGVFHDPEGKSCALVKP